MVTIKGIKPVDLLREEPPEDFGFKISTKWVDIYWGGYEYPINIDRIDTPEKALGWVQHLGEKGWSEMTPRRIGRLVEVLAQRFDWKIYGH